MREIIFRGKAGELWIYGYVIVDTLGFTAINNGHGALFEVDPKTIGQYTGLKDKNGTRIFEGDITAAEGVIYGNGVIFWNDEYCRWDTPCRDGLEKAWEMEIIGNIHEREATP